MGRFEFISRNRNTLSNNLKNTFDDKQYNVDHVLWIRKIVYLIDIGKEKYRNRRTEITAQK